MPNGPGLNGFESLRPQQVTVTAFGRPWILTAQTAYDWIGAAIIDFDDLSGIFPGQLDYNDLDSLWGLSGRGDFSKRCTLTARAALGRASGKDWWWTLNLIRKLTSGWSVINGVMIRQGVRIQDTSLPDYCDAFYSLMWERAAEEDRMKLDIELSMPPKGVRVRQSSAAKKAMLAAFAAD